MKKKLRIVADIVQGIVCIVCIAMMLNTAGAFEQDLITFEESMKRCVIPLVVCLSDIAVYNMREHDD